MAKFQSFDVSLAKVSAKPGRNRRNPDNVQSKESVLAKHLYYDSRIALNYNLRTENGRREFLSSDCEIKIEIIFDEAKLKRLEMKREKSGKYRYVGRVRKR